MRQCAEARIPPHLALMRLFAEMPDEDAARAALASAMVSLSPKDLPLLHAMQELWDRIPHAYSAVSQIHALGCRDIDGDIDGRLNQLVKLFDHAAQISSLAGVALYSLGDERLLDTITREIVDRMLAWNLFDGQSRILDIGCGSGRFLAALAPYARAIVGVDISPAMLDSARERTARLENVLMVRASGRDLPFLADRSFDLVIAIDSFPYLVQAGIVVEHIRHCARLVQTGGHVLVMNFSYRGDPVRDRSEMEMLARRFGFRMLRSGTHDLQLWDGTAFLLQRT